MFVCHRPTWLGSLALAAALGLIFAERSAPAEGPPLEAGANAQKPESHHAEGGDLSHANASPDQGSIVEIKADTAIYSFIVFLLLMVVVTKFAWRPIMEGLDKRESSIAAMIDEAKQSAEKAQASLKEYEARLAAATAETRDMLAQARQDAEAAKERIIAEAQSAAQREREKSLVEIRAAKEAAVREIAHQSVDTAFALARKIVHKELRPADHSALIQESLAQFPSKN